MSKQSLASAGLKLPGAVRRGAVRVVAEDLVHWAPLDETRTLPLLVQPRARGVDLAVWAGLHRAFLNERLQHHGGVLFRGFQLGSAAEFQRLIAAVSGDLLHYTYASTPRTQVSGGIYTSTEYPANQLIPLHNEMSYARSWPLKIWFYCEKTAEAGGETPIADSREVFQKIDAGIRERFTRKQVMYVRNYGGGLDLDWRDVFKTSNPDEVERFCAEEGIEFEWRPEGGLRTRQVCQAIATRGGENVWFNQAHLFHVSGLPLEIRDKLLSQFAPEDLPRNAYYGDGTPIEPESLEEIRRAYEQSMIVFPWRLGDILLLDNVLAAHARMPYQGARRVLVGMAEKNDRPVHRP